MFVEVLAKLLVKEVLFSRNHRLYACFVTKTHAVLNSYENMDGFIYVLLQLLKQTKNMYGCSIIVDVSTHESCKKRSTYNIWKINGIIRGRFQVLKFR